MKIPNVLYVVGLIQAVIAAASPLLAHYNGSLVAVITIAAAVLSAIATYVASKGVKTALGTAAKKAPAKG